MKGELIKKYRKEKLLTQKELGELCGIAETTIRRYELGSLNPKLETLKKIAAALEVPYTDLLDTDSEEFKQFKENRKVFAEQWNDSFKKKKINDLMDQLNEKGQEKAIDQVEMLTKIDEYKK